MGETRFYYSDMAQAMVLDLPRPGWRSRSLHGDWTSDLLGQAVSGSPDGHEETYARSVAPGDPTGRPFRVESRAMRTDPHRVLGGSAGRYLTSSRASIQLTWASVSSSCSSGDRSAPTMINVPAPPNAAIIAAIRMPEKSAARPPIMSPSGIAA